MGLDATPGPPTCPDPRPWIGTLLYLEAEAAGVRSTGIGCFFDDAMHKTLGLEDRSFQTLYHFTVGGAVDDPRLRTLSAYTHRD